MTLSLTSPPDSPSDAPSAGMALTMTSVAFQEALWTAQICPIDFKCIAPFS